MKNFFKILFISLGVVFCILIIAIIAIFSAVRSGIDNPVYKLKNGQVLEISIAGEIPELPPEEMEKLISKNSYCFYELLSSIRRAAEYDEIKGIYLNFTGASPGWAQTEELVKELNYFKSRGKEIWAYFDYMDDCGYSLASAADRIYCSKNAILLLDGLSANIMFYKDTLKKIGIEFEAVRHGKYKSAVEPFTLSDISRENREMLTVYLNSISKNYTGLISRNRKIKNIENIINKGPFLITKELKDRKLVDDICIEEEVFLRSGFSREDLVSISDFLKVPEKIPFDQKNRIALIIAEGEILGGRTAGKGIINDRALIKDLKTAFDDVRVKALVLRINSPGGSGSASDNIWQFIESQKKKKPLIVSMGDFAASGGYYIGMSGKKIFADRNTTTGSIGVFFIRPLLEGLYEKIGLNVVRIKTAPNAGFFTQKNRFTEQQREKVQNFIDDFYSDFVNKAAKGRGKKYEEIEALAGGRIWSGSQAKENGLIDFIGGIIDALEAAKKAGDMENKNPAIDIYPESRPLIEQLFDRNLYLKGDISKLARYAGGLKEKGEAKLIMPYTLELD